jgi:quinol monooxygenase YgiN
VFDVYQGPDDPARFVLYEAHLDQAAHRWHLKMGSFKWFRAIVPDLIVPGSESAQYHRQVLTRRPFLSE